MYYRCVLVVFPLRCNGRAICYTASSGGKTGTSKIVNVENRCLYVFPLQCKPSCGRAIGYTASFGGETDKFTKMNVEYQVHIFVVYRCSRTYVTVAPSVTLAISVVKLEHGKY